MPLPNDLNYLKKVDDFVSTRAIVMHFLTNTHETRKDLFLMLF